MKSKTLQSILQSRALIVVEVVIILVLGVAIAQEVIRKHDIDSEVSRLEQQITTLEDQNVHLAQVLKEMMSENYLEKEARQKLDVQKPGETVVLIPQNSDTGKEIIVETSQNSSSDDIEKARPSLWWEYFFS